jgi:YHS domain-containing protein
MTQMATVDDLADRIDAEFTAATERVKQLQSKRTDEFHDRQQRLENFEESLASLRATWQPRLELLAEKFGERVNVQPHIEPGRRSGVFEFQSELARIKLTFSVSPDPDVRKLIFSYDLFILPILMKFDSHDEIEFPLDKVDEAKLAQWLDDRIVDFVETYLSLHENQYYLQGHMVEDPIAKVSFPKYAAGATFEAAGKKYYFIDETSRDQFQRQMAAVK